MLPSTLLASMASGHIVPDQHHPHTPSQIKLTKFWTYCQINQKVFIFSVRKILWIHIMKVIVDANNRPENVNMFSLFHVRCPICSTSLSPATLLPMLSSSLPAVISCHGTCSMAFSLKICADFTSPRGAGPSLHSLVFDKAKCKQWSIHIPGQFDTYQTKIEQKKHYLYKYGSA